jgi:two-component system, sensor histidine kinase and response regulator
MAGAAAIVLPLLAAFVAGPVVGLAASLLLTLALLAAGWQLLGQPGAPSSRLSPARVLLVEDDPVSRRVVLRLLERLGVNADQVGDGQAAVEAAAVRQYVLVLMDCQLPLLDGYAAARAIRQQEAAAGRAAVRLPIVALTASSLDANHERCLAAGMDDVLTKPLDLGRLAEVMARWKVPHQPPAAPRPPVVAAPAVLSPPASTATMRDAPLAPVSPALGFPAPTGAPPVLDPAGLPLVSGHLSEPYQEIVQLFRQEASRRMAALVEAAARSDWLQLARVAHTLAGSARSIGAVRLAAASAALEALAQEAASERILPKAPLPEAIETVRRALHELDAVLARLTATR